MYDSYTYAIVALLPLAALMLILQVNPYNALVLRGILGAIAALAYTVLGAADVALTEALVGTMLAITLYAVAVRSSLVMRLGILKDSLVDEEPDHPFAQLIANLRTVANKYYLRLELVPYPDSSSLKQALLEKEVHVTCLEQVYATEKDSNLLLKEPHPYHTTTRIRRLHDILQSELSSLTTSLTYITAPDSGEKA